jgi:hypothetical protein
MLKTWRPMQLEKRCYIKHQTTAGNRGIGCWASHKQRPTFWTLTFVHSINLKKCRYSLTENILQLYHRGKPVSSVQGIRRSYCELDRNTYKYTLWGKCRIVMGKSGGTLPTSVLQRIKHKEKMGVSKHLNAFDLLSGGTRLEPGMRFVTYIQDVCNLSRR